jgi:hypothetical protein
MFMKAMHRAFALGAKHGLRAIPMYSDSSVDTPQIDDSAEMSGAVGIVITLAAVIISLYITAIVVGSFSKSISGGSGWYGNGTAIGGGGLGLPAAWNQTTAGLDTNANSSFGLANVLPIAIVGVGILVIIISAFAMR